MKKIYDKKIILYCLLIAIVGNLSLIFAYILGSGIDTINDPKDYFGTYYLYDNSTIVTINLSNNNCEWTEFNGLETTKRLDCEYKYVSAKQVQRKLHIDEYDGCPAIIINVDSSNDIVLYITSTNPHEFAINKKNAIISTSKINFSEVMNDPKNYYGIYKCDSDNYLVLHDNGSVTYCSNGYQKEIKKYVYANKDWLKYHFNIDMDAAIVLLTTENQYMIFECSNSKSLRYEGTTFEKEMYSIVCDLNGGSMETLNPTTYNRLQSITLMNPTKEGYTFIGWSGTGINDKSMSVIIPFGSTGDKAYEANWQANTYNISIDANGGECSIDNLQATYNEGFTIPNPTKMGYRFIGWYYNDKLYDTTKYTTTSDITLVAKWKAKTYTITFDTNGGTLESNKLKVEYASYISLPKPIKKGYTFEAWLYNGSVYNNETYIDTKNITLSASWALSTLTITYNLNGGINNETNPSTYTILDEIKLASPTKEGYEFKGWYLDEDFNQKVKIINEETSATVLYAKWACCLTYDIKSGHVIITGVNNDTTFQKDIVILNNYDGFDVLAIGDMAFHNCTLLKSVTLPNSVTSIGKYAFSGCTSLTSITIPNSVTSIGKYAFSGCTSLTSITIPDSVTSIGSYAFEGCTALTKVNILDLQSWLNIEFIDAYSNPIFLSHTLYIDGVLLTNLSIPESVTSIGDRAFSSCTSLTNITIPDSVTSIGSYAFSNCTSLTSITLPDSLTSIGYAAFSFCTSLTSITIPNKVAYIGSSFYDCYRLVEVINKSALNIKNVSYDLSNVKQVITDEQDSKLTLTSDGFYLYDDGTDVYLVNYIGDSNDITIPNNVTNINQYAFYYCTSLTSITIPDSVTSMGGEAFRGCTSLTSITIPDSVTSIGGSAFRDCTSLTNITIPDSVTSIGDSAFDGCPIEEATIPTIAISHIKNNMLNKVVITSGTSIGDWAFSSCTLLKSVTLPNSVTSIGKYAFSGCTSLTSITIPDSVTSIGDWAFYNCPIEEAIIPSMACSYIKNDKLKKVTITSGTSIGDWAFSSCTLLKSVTLPNSVTSIGKYAFYNCTSLTSITIPDSVTSIGDWAFSSCTSLTSITIPNSVTSIGDSAFYNCPIEEATIPSMACSYIKNDKLKKVTITSGTSIGDSAFSNCTSLTSITIPDSVTSIGGSAFSGCTSLTSITIPDSVTSIGDWAFDGCTSLTSIIIPKSVTSIGKYAFYNCYRLVEVINKSALNIKNGSYSLSNVKQVITDEQDSKLTLTSDGFYLYDDGTDVYLVNYIGDSNDITIPNNVTNINQYAFYYCTSLTSITIPDSVTSMGGEAFSGCTSLTSITIPDSVTSMGSEAFSGCTSLTSITIPDSVTSIGYNVFSGCTSLTSITIPDSVTGIGHYAFNSCSSLTSITIPDSVTSIGYSAFSGCTSLTSITIPDSVTSIGNNAFSNCTSLANITIPDSVTSIGYSAFYGCTSLTIYCRAPSKPYGWADNWKDDNCQVIWNY